MIEPGGYVRDILQKRPGTPVIAHGWVKTRRDSKGVSFLQLSDGSSFADLQVVIDAGTIPDAILSQATTGACVRVEGDLVASPGAKQAGGLEAGARRAFRAAARGARS